MDWDAFLPHVLPSVDQCPDVVAITHVIKAAREFCTRTRVWNFECDPVPSVAGSANYVVQLDDGQELVHVFSLFVGDREYPVSTGFRARRAARAGCSQEAARLNFGTREVVLSPPPGRDDLQIVLDVAVTPSLTATEWPDDLSEYLPDIAQGAVSSLCQLPRQPWRDAQHAVEQRAAFVGRMEDVRYAVSNGHSRTARPHRGVFF